MPECPKVLTLRRFRFNLPASQSGQCSLDSHHLSGARFYLDRLLCEVKSL